MKRILCIAVLCALSAVPMFAQPLGTEADDEQAIRDNRYDSAIAAAGGLAILADDQIIRVPIADVELYDRGTLFRAIGSPLLLGGVVVTSLSAIGWIGWLVSVFLTPGLTSLIGAGNSITQQFLALTAPLFTASVILTTIGGAALIAGATVKSLGDDYHERSFTALP